jgi:hypothetical protein
LDPRAFVATYNRDFHCRTVHLKQAASTCSSTHATALAASACTSAAPPAVTAVDAALKSSLARS